MQLKKFTLLFYLHQFLFDFILLYAVEKLFFISRGISYSQIGLLLFLWSFFSIILELPSGILADKWSRRKMMIISGISYFLCYFTWLFSHSFGMFLIGYIFRTIGSTFTSGTLQAYLYDFLKSHKQENSFEKILGRGNAFRTLGISIALLLGGYLSQISYELVVIISFSSILVISFIAFLWPEIRPEKSTDEEKIFIHIKDSISTIFKNPNLLTVLLFSIAVLGTIGSTEEYNDIFLSSLGFSNSKIGFLIALITIGQSIASAYAYKFKQHTKPILLIVALLSGITFLLISQTTNQIIFIGILLLGIIFEFSKVLSEGIIQRNVNDTKRATIASLNSLIMDLLPIQLVFGIIAERYNLQKSYLTMCLFVISSCIILITLNRLESIKKIK